MWRLRLASRMEARRVNAIDNFVEKLWSQQSSGRNRGVEQKKLIRARYVRFGKCKFDSITFPYHCTPLYTELNFARVIFGVLFGKSVSGERTQKRTRTRRRWELLRTDTGPSESVPLSSSLKIDHQTSPRRLKKKPNHVDTRTQSKLWKFKKKTPARASAQY